MDESIVTAEAPSWSNTGTITGEDLNEVHCPDANNCWTVGTNGIIFRWTPATGWVSQTSNTTENLNGVYCVSSTDCWAVGDNGVVLHWDGVSWSSNIAPVVLRWNGATWANASGLIACRGKPEPEFNLNVVVCRRLGCRAILAAMVSHHAQTTAPESLTGMALHGPVMPLHRVTAI